MDSIRRKLRRSLCLALVLCSCASANGEVKAVHAKAGSTVTLPLGAALKTDEQMLWTFGASEPNTRIARVSPSKAFRASPRIQSRLHVDRGTGDLTLSNLTLNDTGVYKAQRIGAFIAEKLFKLTVYNPLSTPSINIVEPPGGCQPLLLECSSDNSRNLSLSWFREGVRLKNTSSLELARLSLTLKVGLDENSTYICEAQNPVDKKSTTVRPNERSLKNGESSSWCQSELTVRLVLSAVVGLLLIVLVVDHLRITK